MARPYKGDRLPLSSKIPRRDADKLEAISELMAESKSDIVARLVHEWLETVDIEKLRARHGQEALIA